MQKQSTRAFLMVLSIFPLIIAACVPLTLQSDLSRMRLRGEKPLTKVSGLPVAQPGFFLKKSRIELAMACHIRRRR